MDQYSILERTTSPLTIGSLSAQIADSVVDAPSTDEPRFPGEDAGRSLAEMAQRDLDAALQLLADRAHYITGASGAAVALRRVEHRDLLCRASAGSNAPQLGTLLSMEYGLSGECVRSRQLVRCDDSERDPRVNKVVCRDLGIACVVVIPVLSDGQVIGVFELFSGQPGAFNDRDLSAILRLSQMVETAVKYAIPTCVIPPVAEAVATNLIPEVQPQVDVDIEAAAAANVEAPIAELPPPAPEPQLPAPIELSVPQKDEPPAPAKKPLFWSAGIHASASPSAGEQPETIAVPPVLRNFQKCQACGFPVSQGRAFCVECEERQWRGQRLPHPAVAPPPPPPTPPPTDSRKFTGLADALRAAHQNSSELKPLPKIAEAKLPDLKPADPTTADDKSTLVAAVPLQISAPTSTVTTEQNSIVPATELPEVSASDNSAPFLSSALPAESWFSSNKYILATLVIVAIIIAAIALLR
jgi:hypothetical protein